MRAPSAFAMTVGSPPSRTETTELVVPRSIPTARAMCVLLLPAQPSSRADHIESDVLKSAPPDSEVSI